MAEQSFPFENIDTTESQFSEWATNFQETGVQGSPTGTELGITVTGSDLNLTVAAGQAFIRGHYYINTSDLVLPVTSAGVNTRIDIVVVELDPEANTIVTKIVSGEAVAADPVAPTLTQSATGIYQLPIATLTIPTSTVVITAGMLVDTRTFMGNRVGIWTTATRPANPTAYQTLGYNTTLEIHEYWNGSTWGSFSPDLSGLIPKSTVTTAQDLIVADGASSVTRLGVGTDDQVLSVVAGEVAWADAGGGGLVWTQIYNSTMPTNGATSTVTGLGGYDNYKIIFSEVQAITTVTGFLFYLQINGDESGVGVHLELDLDGGPHQFDGSTTMPIAGIRNDFYTFSGAVSVQGASGTSLASVVYKGGSAQNSSKDLSFLGEIMANKNSSALTSIGIRVNNGYISQGSLTVWGA